MAAPGRRASAFVSPVVNGQSVMTDEAVEDLAMRMREISDPEGVLGAVGEALASSLVTCQQMTMMIGVAEDPELRLAVARVACPKVVDPKQAATALPLFHTAADKQAVQELLKAREESLTSETLSRVGRLGRVRRLSAMRGRGRGRGGRGRPSITAAAAAGVAIPENEPASPLPQQGAEDEVEKLRAKLSRAEAKHLAQARRIRELETEMQGLQGQLDAKSARVRELEATMSALGADTLAPAASDSDTDEDEDPVRAVYYQLAEGGSLSFSDLLEWGEIEANFESGVLSEDGLRVLWNLVDADGRDSLKLSQFRELLEHLERHITSHAGSAAPATSDADVEVAVDFAKPEGDDAAAVVAAENPAAGPSSSDDAAGPGRRRSLLRNPLHANGAAATSAGDNIEDMGVALRAKEAVAFGYGTLAASLAESAGGGEGEEPSAAAERVAKYQSELNEMLRTAAASASASGPPSRSGGGGAALPRGRVVVVASHAREIKSTQMFTRQDPYVKATLLQWYGESQVARTKMHEGGHVTPAWDASLDSELVMEFAGGDAEQLLPLMIEVLNENLVADDVIGSVELDLRPFIVDAPNAALRSLELELDTGGKLYVGVRFEEGGAVRPEDLEKLERTANRELAVFYKQAARRASVSA